MAGRTTRTKLQSDRVLRLRVDKQHPTPVYMQIVEGVQALAKNGDLVAGAALPPERVICEQLGISRMTLRQAFDILERQELISCQRGRGTFVSVPRLHKQQQEFRSFSEEMAVRGATASSQLLSFRRTAAGFAAREFFGLPQHECVYEITRVRLSDGTPLAIETVQIPQFLCPGLDQFSLATNSLYKILEEHYGLWLARCTERISAALPNATQKTLLLLPRSAVILLVERETYSSNDVPVEMASTAFRGDLYTALVRSSRTRKNPV